MKQIKNGIMENIIIYMYKKDFGYEALTELIKKYDLAELKYVEGETKPSYVITTQEIEDIFEKENMQLSFTDKLSVEEILRTKLEQQEKLKNVIQVEKP